MLRNLPQNTLIGQEKRATTLFLFLLLIVISIIDLLISIIGDEDLRIQIQLLTPYIFLYMLVPFTVVKKKLNQRYIKYVFFSVYMIISFINEIFIFWGSSDYIGGVLLQKYSSFFFSPIFVNKKFFWIVVTGVFGKYFFIGFLQL